MSTYKAAPPSYDFRQSPEQGHCPQQECTPMQGFPAGQGFLQQQEVLRRYEYTPDQEFPPRRGNPPQPEYGQPPVHHGYAAHHHVDTQILVAPDSFQLTEPPPDYMCCAVLVCLCCFWPLGLRAITLAYQAQNAYNRGDYIRARRNASSAKTFIILSLIFGVVLIAASIGFYCYRYDQDEHLYQDQTQLSFEQEQNFYD